MFDFRYHALSLVAVFLALGIGIVLGVTIGDSLVSEAEQGVRASLREDVVDARDQAEELRRELARRERVIEQAFPLLVDDRLAGERIAAVSFGSMPDDVRAAIGEAVQAADGELVSTSTLDEPLDERRLANVIGGRFERLGADEDLLRLLGQRIGRSIATGGRIAGALERALPDDFRGDYAAADGVVVYRAPREERSETTDAFEAAVIEGLRSANVPVVGVESGETEPSQIPYYRDRELSSVDSVDTTAGRAALALALAGARGTWGFKDTADEPLPPPSER